MKRFSVALLIFSGLLLIAALVYGGLADIRFEQNCKGFLKRAADSNTVKLAKQELGKAVAFIETAGLTEGDTSFLYSTPRCDLGFWYTNLKASLTELNEMPTDTDLLTVSNQLLKLRETIMDSGEKGTRVTLPPNISVYPNQVAYRLTIAIALILLVCGGVALAVSSEPRGQPCES